MALESLKRFVYDKVYGSTKDNAFGVQRKELADARMGVVYFLGNLTSVRTAPPPMLGMGSSMLKDLVGDSEIVTDVGKGALKLLENVSVVRATVAKAKAISDWTEEKKQQILKMLEGYFARFADWLKKNYGMALDSVEGLAEVLKWLHNKFAKTLADAIPGWGYVSTAGDIYSGVKKGVDGAKRWVEQMYAGYGVKLLGGHPAVISRALATYSVTMFVLGAKDVVGGGMKIAAMAAGDAAGGVGSLIATILGILANIYTFVDKVLQRYRLKNTFTFAREQWKLRGSENWIGAEHKKFAEWFQGAVSETPVVAGLTLLSGYAAHPYRFAQLLDPGDKLVTQSQFDKAADYIQKLKQLGTDMVKAWVKTYETTFEAKEAYVANRLDVILHGEGILHPVEMTANPLRM